MKQKQIPKENQPASPCCNAVLYAHYHNSDENEGIEYIYCTYCEKKYDTRLNPIEKGGENDRK